MTQVADRRRADAAGAARRGRRHRGLQGAELLRRLTESGHSVRVLPTASALEFVGAATFEALSGQPVHTGLFTDVPAVPHVRLGQQADLVVVAPATADLLARAAHGRADDLLTATLLTARCPMLMAPAMHTEMWHHPATVANVELLRSRGCGRDGAGVGPADRRRLRPWSATGARRDRRAGPAAHRTRRGVAPGPHRPAGRGVRRRHPGAAGPGAGSWATGPPVGRATRWPRWPRSAAPR